MKKLLLIVIITIISITSLIHRINAEDNPEVVYDGNTGNFSSSGDVFLSFDNVVPGDKIEQDILFKLKNINGLTKLYIEIQNDAINVPDSIKYLIYVDNTLVLDGLNKDLSSYLVCQSEHNKNIDFKVLVDVPVSVGNEIKNISKDSIWTFVVEDDFGKHKYVITGVDEYREGNRYIQYLPYLAILAVLFVLFSIKQEKQK